MGNLVPPCMNRKKMQDSGFRLSGGRQKIHVRVEHSLISIQAPEESNASRHFRQWPNAKFQTKYGERLARCLFSFRAKHIGINMRGDTPSKPQRRSPAQNCQKYTLPWVHQKRQSVQTCPKVSLFFSHSEVQVHQAYPAPQVRPPSEISGADPKCKGLTCFSKTQNEKSRSTSPYMMTDPLP